MITNPDWKDDCLAIIDSSEKKLIFLGLAKLHWESLRERRELEAA